MRVETVVATHINTDFDAFGAMLAARRLYPGAVVCLAGSLNRNVREFYRLHADELDFVVEASRLVEGGVATVDDVDVACRLGFGHAMGPLETMDLIGIDVMVDAADNIAAETPGTTFAVPELLRQMVAQGRLGRKTERGFYDY